MAHTYLSHRSERGAARSLDDHVDVELMLESYASEHADLRDRVAALQEVVSTTRIREQLRLSNERNRIMRLELILGFGTTSLALSACVGGFFGMNLDSGIESSPHLLWAVSGAAVTASSVLFAGLVLGVRRFNAEQGRQVLATASLEQSLASLDTAYYALRERGLLGDDKESEPGSLASTPVSKEVLGDVLASASVRLAPGELDELWTLLDTNDDGVLSAADEVCASSPESGAPDEPKPWRASDYPGVRSL